MRKLAIAVALASTAMATPAVARDHSFYIGGEQVVGSRAAAIDSPTGGATVDSEARLAINAILGALREHGLIEI